MRLSRATAARLARSVERPRYDAAAEKVGMVHLGVGAFHRAHQAVYADDAMGAGDRHWRITGVSLHSTRARDELAPQDGLFTVTQQDASDVSTRLVGSIAQVLAAPLDPRKVVAALADPAVRVVTMTVTEKGYHLASDGRLDLAADEVRRDLSGEPPVTMYGFLALALAARRAQGAAGLTLLSCDNLAENGRKLSDALATFLTQTDPRLADWMLATCRCPSSMVDRIVPAATAEMRKEVGARIGVDDAAAIRTEAFRQWVIEDRFAGGRPHWEAGGAAIVGDVRPYEVAKLRMLNGAHSALAYLGLERGLRFVHEAVADEAIRPLVDTLMRREAADSIEPAPDQDLQAYATALAARFANPGLAHRLDQIAMDGSQKIPQRWLHTLAFHQARGRSCPALLTALAAWMRHVRGDGVVVHDPLAGRLLALWAEAGEAGIVDALFGDAGLFQAQWPASPANRGALTDQLRVRPEGMRA